MVKKKTAEKTKTKTKTPPKKKAAEIKEGLNNSTEVIPAPDENDYGEPVGKVEDYPTVYSLPDDFPVVPLGVLGEVAYFLDGMSQLRELKFKEFVKTRLQSLFIPAPKIVETYWPRWNKEGKKVKNSWAAEAGSTVLMTHVAKAGIFNPMDKIRGRGCHLSDSGQLIWHLGNGILIEGEMQKPGLIGAHVYPGAEKCVPPKHYDDIDCPGYELRDILNQWFFQRPGLDSHLLLGWVMAAMVGGALAWRPLMWITGDSSTGKSTLHEVIVEALGNSIDVTDPSGPGIWQKTQYDTLPVIIDELEAEEDNRRSANVIKLARQAASGGKILRGSSDHQAREFHIKSCFMFSSILHPPLPPQDQNRIAILNLKEIPQGTPKPLLDQTKIKRIGQSLKSRFHRYHKIYQDVFSKYYDGLVNVGHKGRSADVYGHLLACAHIAEFNQMPTQDQVKKWCDQLDYSVINETDDKMNDAHSCIHHLLTSEIDPHQSGSKKVVSEVIYAAVKKDSEYAKRGLERHGMKIINVAGHAYLLVGNQHKNLLELFKGTHWMGRPDTPGVWIQSLRRLPGAKPWMPSRFMGVNQRSTALKVSKIIDFDDFQTVKIEDDID